MTLVDGTDLVAWANRRSSQEILPQLLRRLVHGTVDNPIRVEFPAGEGVQLEGWDGIVAVEAGNAFVPSGISVWEMGVTRGIKGKADSDYEKRRQDPRGVDPAESTLVFVTPRRWKGKDEWINDRQRDGAWRQVRAYDADDLEAWLERAPAVHVWVSIVLGKHPETAVDLGSCWLDWAGTTRPVMTAELVLSGRAEVAERVRAWLTESAAPLALQAESRDEALAVLEGAELPVAAPRLRRLGPATHRRSIAPWQHD